MTQRTWSASGWQSYTNALLSTHHSLRKEKYQRIPDVGGDHGLEGISDTGDAYQAYADQDSRDHDEQVRKQKDKIYEDLRKLDKYKEWWTEFLGDRKLRRWHLMVPELADKEVVKYARHRARELRKLNLSFIADDFEAYVCTADDFPDAKLVARDPHLPRRTPGSVTEADITAFLGEDPVFIQKLDEKIEKIMPIKTPEQRLDFRTKLLKWHLEAWNFGTDLEQKFPPQGEELEVLITTTGESLETEGPLDASAPNVRLTRAKRDFAEAVKEKLPFIVHDDREVIAWGTVARWLGECPLDF